MVNLKNLC